MIHNDKNDSNMAQQQTSEFNQFSNKLARLASLGMLSGWLMHDFRNKLAVISGNIQIIQIKKTDISPDVLASRLAIAMKMIEETLKLFDDIGSFSQRAAGIAMEISTEKAINRTVAILKRQFEQFGIRVKKNGADPDYTFRCDAGLFDYILISLIEMLLPYNRTEGELILSSSLQENEWKMDAHLTIVGNNSTVSEDFRNRIVSMEMNVIQMGIKELNGKLEVSHTDESMGFELRLPV